MPEQHPLVQAIAPLVERLNAELVDAADARTDDVTLEWDGKPVVAVRLPSPAPAKASEKEGGVQSLLAAVAEELGGPLRDLSRHDKQQAVLLLEARGAFEYRKSAEIVAEALGVTRFTVYNYLNRAR
ncbi:HTH domain-containing protein [Kribbella sp. VKM Ac-2569]|uniref:helix-turn-helix domain-containing protein n=1 Tax=Kribbella sp. VKM Ac-2569 TaxID=2512220 RepID=UPI00102CAC99|nr:helix-turn-helix domain-containing protein [Kribbella sp. VKM Ac-2569]RZT15078.1 HTH domain-containing protein [Kribbella sp. VKM Ac-2569]